MFAFSRLPNELQLEILDQCDSRSLTRMLQTNKSTRLVSLYTLNQKINHLLGLSHNEEENLKYDVSPISSPTPNLYISLYSPQQVNRKKEFYETKCVTSISSSNVLSRNGSSTDLNVFKSEQSQSQNENTNSTFMNNVIDKLRSIEIDQQIPSSTSTSKLNESGNSASVYQTTALQNDGPNSLQTSIQLGKLKGFKDPLKSSDDLLLADEEAMDQKSDLQKSLHILVDEESTSFKIHFELLFKAFDAETNEDKMIKLAADSKRLSTFEDQGIIVTEGDSISISYKLIKGEENPPRGPYDYTIMTNYYIQFESFQINNSYLLHRFENSNP